MKLVPRKKTAFLSGLALIFLAAVTQAKPPIEVATPPGKLNVVARVVEPFIMEKDGKPAGYSMELWQEVAERNHLQFDLKMVDTVPDLLQALREGKADVAIGALTINAERQKTIDFSYPIYLSGLKIAVLDADRIGFFSSLERYYSGNFPLVIGVSLGVLLLGLALSSRFSPGGSRAALSPGRAFLRITVAMFSLFLISGLVAIIFNALGSSRSDGIKGLGDLPGRKVGTLAGTSADDELQEIGVAPRYYSELHAALLALQKGRLDAVVYDAPMLAYQVREMKGEIRLLPPLFNRQAYGFGLKDANGDLRKKINLTLQNLSEEGFLEKLDQKWFGDLK